jgi:hypothetical protein
MDLQPGTRVDSYVLEAFVGGGGFGAVWRGRDEDGRPVAIKFLTGTFSTQQTAGLRADVEVLAAAAVSSRSEHVIKVLGGGHHGAPYIVMEYIEGSDLASLLDGGTLPVARVVEVGVAIMDALRALNEAGIIHRDIKPANVMIDSRGVIKLADFGIAKIVGYDSITMTGQAALTMAYAAPEVWDEDASFGRPSHKSDLYAAGIVLYQCLTGDTPFKGNYGALYRAHVEHRPNLERLPADTPASLRDLVARCLAKRQEDRPEDAGACLRLLERAAIEIKERSGVAPANEPRRFGPWQRQSPHPTLPFAWHCVHESSGDPATVEVNLAATPERLDQLRSAVEASEALAGYGAERLIAAGELRMGHGEAWQAAPAAPHLYWVAREDAAPAPLASVSSAQLYKGATALAALIDAAEAAGLGLALADNIAITGSGIYVSRPGLGTPDADVRAAALAAIRALPLSAEARSLLPATGGFEALLVSVQSTQEQTQFLTKPAAVGNEESIGPAPSPTLDLRRLTFGRSRSDYELALTNAGEETLKLLLSGSSSDDRLRVDLPAGLSLPPGASERVRVAVSAKRRSWAGAKRLTPFVVSASAAGGGAGAPPVAVTAEFAEEPSRAPLLAAGGFFGIVAAAALALVALSGDGRPAAGEEPPAAAATEVAATSTPEPTATPEPPTPTPEPPPPTEVPAPTPRPATPPTPRPVVVASTATPAPPPPPPPPPPTQPPPPTSTPGPPTPTATATLAPIPTCDNRPPIMYPGLQSVPGPAVVQGSGFCTAGR